MAYTRLSSPLASRPLASSCSLQRFNAILCKFVCGQVYMVPGLSVSSIHPSPLFSTYPPLVLLVVRHPASIHRHRLPPCPPFSTLWVNIAESVSTHTRSYLCTYVFITACTHRYVHAMSKKPRTCSCMSQL